MRSHKLRLLLLALGTLSFAAAGTGGCGGGDDNNAGGDDGGSQGDTSVGGDDGGVGDGGSTDSGGDTNVAPQANAADVSVYLGQTVQLDGSGSSPAGATFAWTVDSAPGGSAITTGSVLNANAAKPSFTPDVLGDYKLTLTVSTGASTKATKQVTAHVLDAPLFYVRDHNVTGLPYYEVRTVGASGGTDTPIVCAMPEDASTGGGLPPESYERWRTSLGGMDWFEAPPGTPSEIAFVMAEREGDGGLVTYVAAGTTASSCPSALPRRLDSMLTSGSTPGPFYAPRISPDGTRVVYLKSDGAGARFASIGFDGSNPHSHIAPMAVYPDGGPQADATAGNPNLTANAATPVEPRWLPGNKIGWMIARGGNRFEIHSVADADDSAPTVALGCSGNALQFDALANGDFVVAGRVAAADGAVDNGSDIYVLHPNALTHECEVVHNLSNLQPFDGGSSSVSEFALSPDKARVAYLAYDVSVDAGGGDRTRLAVAPVDGSSPATLVSGLALGAGGAENLEPGAGPHWIAGGSKLTLAQAAVSIDASDGGAAIVVVPAAGGAVKTVAATSIGDGYRVYGAAHQVADCSIGYGPGSAFVALGSLGAFLGLIVRRRRRGV